jgi:Flp pilus assembly pilin Flp
MAISRRFLKALQSEDRGQDVAEYCLLTALVALLAVAVLIHLSGGMSALWSDANTSLTAGSATSSATSTGTGTASTSAH